MNKLKNIFAILVAIFGIIALQIFIKKIDNPFFLKKNWSQQEIQESSYFKQAIIERREAIALNNKIKSYCIVQINEPCKIDPAYQDKANKNLGEMIEHYKSAASYAKLISPETLKKIHPSIEAPWKDLFIISNEKMAYALKHDKEDKAWEAFKGDNEWMNWYEKNYKDITLPK